MFSRAWEIPLGVRNNIYIFRSVCYVRHVTIWINWVFLVRLNTRYYMMLCLSAGASVGWCRCHIIWLRYLLDLTKFSARVGMGIQPPAPPLNPPSTRTQQLQHHKCTFFWRFQLERERPMEISADVGYGFLRLSSFTFLQIRAYLNERPPLSGKITVAAPLEPSMLKLGVWLRYH